MATNEPDMSEPIAVFKYDDLPGPKAIRLVEIVDSPDLNMMALEMGTCELSEDIEYIALSYTCGQPYRDIENPEAAEIPPVRDHMVLLNGRPILIYQNLYEFLRCLDSNDRPGPLWIDAVCIDQDNKAEKTVQIMLMEEIYAAAEMVLIWMGPDHQHAEHLRWALEVFLPAFDAAIGFDSGPADDDTNNEIDPSETFTAKMANFAPPCSTMPSDPSFVELLGFDDMSEFEERILGCIMFYASCRYFDRAWTFQEIVLAKPGNTVFVCSDLHFGPIIFRLAMIIKEYGWGDGGLAAQVRGIKLDAVSEPFDVVNRWAYFSLAHVLEAKNNPDYYQRPPGFTKIAGRWQTTDHSAAWMMWLFDMTRGLGCTYKRDKLYSLLGMVKRFPGFPTQEYIPTDPDISWQELFVNVTAVILTRAESLDPLNMVESRKTPKTLDGLPSWVPDYLVRQDHTPLISFQSNDVPVDLLFNASRWPKDGDTSFRISHQAITAYGASVDTVAHVCADELASMLSGIKVLVHFLKDVAKSVDAKFDKSLVWKTMLAVECHEKPVEEIEDNDALFAESFRQVCIFLCVCYLYPQEYLRPHHGTGVMELSVEQRRKELNEILATVNDSVLLSNKWTLAEVEERSKFAVETFTTVKSTETDEAAEALLAAAIRSDEPMRVFLTGWRYTARGKRLYITSQGKLVLGPLYAEAGDHIFVLHQSRALQMLRPTSEEKEFTYVGEAYIEGCMHGQLMRGPNSLEKKFHEIKIV